MLCGMSDHRLGKGVPGSNPGNSAQWGIAIFSGFPYNISLYDHLILISQNVFAKKDKTPLAILFHPYDAYIKYQHNEKR